MTNTQKIGAIIVELMEKEAVARAAYVLADDDERAIYKKVALCEYKYTESGKDEEIGKELDKLYDDLNKANDKTYHAAEKLETITEMLEHLRTTMELLENMGE